ncbi:tetratricopeptide repeat protein [Bradyrhizobium sp.]|uniref:tetratricopeptide repeat protein n=1 Tax=Bradyrhizobium sp. TaxID=376 RepID=UPI003D135601
MSERRVAAEGPQNPTSAPPPTPAELFQAGIQHLAAGERVDAQLCCQRALEIDPGFADALHLLGLIALQAQDYDPAVEWLARAIRLDAKPDYLVTLGTCLKLSGRRDEALKVFDKAVQLKPDCAGLWTHLAGALATCERHADAILAYQQALKLNPQHWDAAFHGAVLLHRVERFEEALAHFNLCEQLRPDHAATLQARARTLRALKQLEACLADLERADALSPGDPFTCNNLGDALVGLGRYEEGLAWYSKALALLPDHAEILVNRGFALTQLHRFDEAIEAFRRAVAADPTNARAAYELAHLLLQTGDFEQGWAAREARWRMPGFSAEYPRFSQSKWLGEEDVAGKTILVHIDEGLGDALQFARFIPMLAARGARVILVVQDALVSLLSGLQGVAECVPFSASVAGRLPPFDLHCPLMSLPLALAARLATIPPPPALSPLPPARVAAWEHRLGSRDRLRIGLVWFGNPLQGNDRNRSMPLATLLPLLDLNARFVSLQKDPRPNDKALLNGRPDILDVSDGLTDFVETASLVSCLDLVITVCTSVAHLSATIARPTWVMLPYVADWRWMNNRDDSPWYPSVRLFRQDETRDFARVVARIRAELAAQLPRS